MKTDQEKKDPVATEVEPGSEKDACVTASDIQTPSHVTPAQSRARSRSPQDEAPFIWASAEVLRQIRDHTGSASAVAVYMGLACIANDDRSPVFQARIARIAQMSALRYRATLTALDLLHKAGVISSAGAENSPQGRTYTLLSLVKKGRSNLVKKRPTTYAPTEAHQVPTGSKKLLLPIKVEEVANKTEGDRNNQQPPDAATPARLDGAGAAGVAETRPAVVKPQPRRW